MDFHVFVSHSMRQEDLSIIYSTVHDAQFRGITCYVAERDVQLGHSLPEKIDSAIRHCDCFVVFLTRGGASSEWVNQEIGLAKGRNKLRIQVVEKGVEIKGFDIDKEYIELDRQYPAVAISKLNEHLGRLRSEKEAKQKAALFVAGALVLLALLGGGD